MMQLRILIICVLFSIACNSVIADAPIDKNGRYVICIDRRYEIRIPPNGEVELFLQNTTQFNSLLYLKSLESPFYLRNESSQILSTEFFMHYPSTIQWIANPVREEIQLLIVYGESHFLAEDYLSDVSSSNNVLFLQPTNKVFQYLDIEVVSDNFVDSFDLVKVSVYPYSSTVFPGIIHSEPTAMDYKNSLALASTQINWIESRHKHLSVNLSLSMNEDERSNGKRVFVLVEFFYIDKHLNFENSNSKLASNYSPKKYIAGYYTHYEESHTLLNFSIAFSTSLIIMLIFCVSLCGVCFWLVCCVYARYGRNRKSALRCMRECCCIFCLNEEFVEDTTMNIELEEEDEDSSFQERNRQIRVPRRILVREDDEFLRNVDHHFFRRFLIDAGLGHNTNSLSIDIDSDPTGRVLEEPNEKEYCKRRVIIPEDETCCCCMDFRKSIQFYPCEHVCCCERCSKILNETTKQCPVCRAKIKSYKILVSVLEEDENKFRRLENISPMNKKNKKKGKSKKKKEIEKDYHELEEEEEEITKNQEKN